MATEQARVRTADDDRYGPWDVEGYQVRVECANGIRLVAGRTGPEGESRDLKQLPAAVRRSGEYAWIQVVLEAAIQHQRNLRTLLETALVESVPLSQEDLAMLALDPVGRPMLSGLLVEVAGTVGAPVPDDWMLETLSGDLIRLGAPATVVHPVSLAAAGTLERWEQWLSRRWLKQPFKQIRREVYLPNGDDRRAGSFSDRFAGERVNWMQGRALLEGRGWQRVTKSAGERWYHRARLTGYVEFRTPASRGFSPEDVILNRIFFLPTGELPSAKRDPGMPIERVPPIVFSETLRDVGLVAKVAARSDLGF